MSCFLILILQGLTIKRLPQDCLRRDFGLEYSVETVTDYGTFEFGLNAFLRYDMAISLWGQKTECGDFNENDHKLIA